MNWTSPFRGLARAGVLAVALLVVTGCDRHLPTRTTPPASATRVDPMLCTGQIAYHEAAALVSLGPRDATTPGAAAAADHLVARLTALGATPLRDTFADRIPRGTGTFHNVTCLIEGRDTSRTLLLLSHFDTKSGLGPDFVGANDSGSSCGLLLELAQLYQAHPPPLNVMLAFVDGEECQLSYGPHDGLHGSRQLARQIAAARGSNHPLARVGAVIVVDMIGDRSLDLTIPLNSDRDLAQLAYAAARDIGLRKSLNRGDSRILDDHVPFLEQGIPAIDLIDFAYGSAPGKNDYWHTPADTMDKLSPESLATTGQIVMQMINRF